MDTSIPTHIYKNITPVKYKHYKVFQQFFSVMSVFRKSTINMKEKYIDAVDDTSVEPLDKHAVYKEKVLYSGVNNSLVINKT